MIQVGSQDTGGEEGMETRYWETLGLLLASAAAVTSKVKASPNFFVLETAEAYPPCDVLFGRLERGRNGKYEQSMEASMRGEPKSGTSFTMAWTRDSLFYACDHLRELYGSTSCDIDNGGRHLTFEPSLAKEEAPCACDNIEK